MIANNSNRKFDFINTKEFEVFCNLAGQNLAEIQTWGTEKLKQFITEIAVDETDFEIDLAKAKIDPELLSTFDKLGISIKERDKVLQKQGLLPKIAMDYVVDSTSVHTSFSAELSRIGVIFCSMGEAVQKHPDLVQKYLGSVVPFSDNFFASLNSAVFSDGSFCYIPPNVHCPMELSTYFRINASGTGQFERTLIIADTGSSVSYLEGCTAPQRDENQLHSAVVELVALENATIKYSTVQNWYSGDKNGKGGVYNFVTKRGICLGKNSKISWTQVETGSSITWKYPSVTLKGDGSVGEFYSVATTNNRQQADTGTKMIHIGKNTRSKIISKGISSGNSSNVYRGIVKITSNADNAKNFTQCDSLFVKKEEKIITPQEIKNLIEKIYSNPY
jgi:Fe-S cluster assembly protein SufB